MSVRLCVKEDDMIIEKKPFSFLLPAVLTAALIFHMLPQTQAVLREIPEKLALVAEAEAKEPVKRKAAGGADSGGNSEVPAADGAFEDGVYTGSSNGYGGEITVQVTVENGQIIDIGILSAPGETDLYFSLAQSLLDTVKRAQTWDVDTVSGATYSSRGILGAVRNALTGETVDNEEPPSVEPVGTTSQDSFKDPAAYKDGTYYGTASGFGGPIRVEVVIKDGKIADIRVIDASGETGDYLSRAKGVINRILSKGSPNVDSVSGATYSSTGIINAVKRALSQAAADGSGKTVYQADALASPGIRSPAVKLILPDEPSEYEDGTYYGTADGFGGEIKVEVTVKEGKIAKISVLSAPDETPEYLDKAKGVIPKIIKAGSPNVDTVSGATYSSTGIINAVRQALVKAQKTGEGDSGEGGDGGGESGEDDPGEGGEGSGDDPGESGPEGGGGGESVAARFEDGTYKGSGWCDDGEEFYYEINVTVLVEEGKISRVSVSKGEDESDSPEDNDFYLGWAVNGRTRSGQLYPGLPAQIVSSQSADVDTISGATYSSGTIRSIAVQIISEIPVIEDEEAGNKEEEAQTENNAEGQAVVPAGLPELSAPPAQGSDGPADEAAPDSEESETAAGEESETVADEESETAAGEESEAAAGEENETAADEESEVAADEKGEAAADEESAVAVDEEDERADTAETDEGAGKEGGDGT